ncbi:MAG: proteobacterial dedicated sortase system response regulator [Pseudomonadales bacterium]|nr:proteobacterial dedicated sortase system response regulator [Pseudomonadales bacterium]
MTSYNIAIVEDDDLLRENYSDLFRNQGYQVSGYKNRPDAEAIFETRLPDLAIIDISLENEIDAGFSLCQWLRQRSEMLPIIFLSARDSDIDIVSGLRLGADDYLTKDVSLIHLTARVAALFRRREAMTKPDPGIEARLQQGDLELDSQRFSCRWKGRKIDLTLTEFWMIYSLAKNAGHVKKRQQLMQESHIVVDEASITSQIKRIRKKFLLVDKNFSRIETVYGIGYRWHH